MDENEKQAHHSSSASGVPKPPPPSDSLAAQAPQSRRSEENGFIEGDGSLTDFRNVVRWLTGRLTEDGQRQMRREWSKKYEKEYVARCEKQRDYLLKYSPTIRFLNSKIQQLQGDLNTTNIRCRCCSWNHGGYFSPDFGIKICANQMRDRGHTEDTMAHEMIHAYDFLRFKFDWNNLRHAACTEIRASSLSGECRFMREFFTRQNRKITMQHQECVRRRAKISVGLHPLCRDAAHAEQLVNEVWDSCFADTRPFDEIYR